MTFAKFSELRSNPVPDPILSWMEGIEREMFRRHAWLIEAGEKLRGDAANAAPATHERSRVAPSPPLRVSVRIAENDR